MSHCCKFFVVVVVLLLLLCCRLSEQWFVERGERRRGGKVESKVLLRALTDNALSALSLFLYFPLSLALSRFPAHSPSLSLSVSLSVACVCLSLSHLAGILFLRPDLPMASSGFHFYSLSEMAGGRGRLGCPCVVQRASELCCNTAASTSRAFHTDKSVGHVPKFPAGSAFSAIKQKQNIW